MPLTSIAIRHPLRQVEQSRSLSGQARWPIGRQYNPDAQASAGQVFGRYPTAMQADNSLGTRQAEAGMAVPRCEKRQEQAIQALGGKAWAIVHHGPFDFACIPPRTRDEADSLLGGFTRIGQQCL